MPIDVSETAWHADSTNSGEVRRAGEDVSQVHLQRTGGALAQFERWHRQSWRNQCVDFLKRLREILADQLTHFLRTQIIRIIITRTQNVGAENDPAFHFRSKTFLARAAIMIEQIFWIFRSIAVT